MDRLTGTLEVAAHAGDPVLDAAASLRGQVGLAIQGLLVILLGLADDQLLGHDNVIIGFLRGNASALDLVHDAGLEVGLVLLEGPWHVVGQLELEGEGVLALQARLVVAPVVQHEAGLDDLALPEPVPTQRDLRVVRLEPLHRPHRLIVRPLLLVPSGRIVLPPRFLEPRDIEDDAGGRVRLGRVDVDTTLDYFPGQIELLLGLDVEAGFGFAVTH